jgi:RNA polymerase sigma-70 factor (ECF subfamily)
MELENTEMRTRNDPPGFETIRLAMGAPRHSNDEPLVNSLRTEHDLVQAAKSGDHEAFAELCRRHARGVRGRILTIVRHQEDAEDALQETLFRAYANLGRFRQSCKFSTWITAIGINAALTVIRKKKTRREEVMELDGNYGSTWDAADLAPDPERCVANGQLILVLRKELESLPPKMQEVIARYYDHDYSIRQAAEALGISAAAAKSRLTRVRRTLRLSFKRKGLLGSHL